jgi:hypothetical protein
MAGAPSRLGTVTVQQWRPDFGSQSSATGLRRRAELTRRTARRAEAFSAAPLGSAAEGRLHVGSRADGCEGCRALRVSARCGAHRRTAPRIRHVVAQSSARLSNCGGAGFRYLSPGRTTIFNPVPLSVYRGREAAAPTRRACTNSGDSPATGCDLMKQLRSVCRAEHESSLTRSRVEAAERPASPGMRCAGALSRVPCGGRGLSPAEGLKVVYRAYNLHGDEPHCAAVGMPPRCPRLGSFILGLVDAIAAARSLRRVALAERARHSRSPPVRAPHKNQHPVSGHRRFRQWAKETEGTAVPVKVRNVPHHTALDDPGIQNRPRIVRRTRRVRRMRLRRRTHAYLGSFLIAGGSVLDPIRAFVPASRAAYALCQ